MGLRKENKVLKIILISISFIFLGIFLILPLIYIIVTALRDGISGYVNAVSDEYAIKAAILTIQATVWAVIINTIFGISAAWLITKYAFKGKKILSTFIDLPVTVSPISTIFRRISWKKVIA